MRKFLKRNGKTVHYGEPKDTNRLNLSLDKNIQYIKEALGNSFDNVIRPIKLGHSVQACIVYNDGLIDLSILQDFMDSLLNNNQSYDLKHLQTFKEQIMTVGEILEVPDYQTLLNHILSGHAVLLIENQSTALSVNLPGYEKRSIEEPQSATLIKGPRDGFTETLGTNTSLIRRRIKSTNLWMEAKEIGTVTKTSVVIAYINGLVNENIIKEVHERLDKITIDAI